jgi:anti-sigma factor RsiW
MGHRAMTTDILRDYMLGRLSGTERQRVRDHLRVDPRLRGALRRLRNTTVRVRARLGSQGAVQPVPRDGCR